MIHDLQGNATAPTAKGRCNAARETTVAERAQRPAERIRSERSSLELQAYRERVEKAFDALSETHREVIRLNKYEGLSFGEIGERLDKSPDACRTLLARAMTALTLKMRGITKKDVLFTKRQGKNEPVMDGARDRTERKI